MFVGLRTSTSPMCGQMLGVIAIRVRFCAFDQPGSAHSWKYLAAWLSPSYGITRKTARSHQNDDIPKNDTPYCVTFFGNSPGSQDMPSMLGGLHGVKLRTKAHQYWAFKHLDFEKCSPSCTPFSSLHGPTSGPHLSQ